MSFPSFSMTAVEKARTRAYADRRSAKYLQALVRPGTLGAVLL